MKTSLQKGKWYQFKDTNNNSLIYIRKKDGYIYVNHFGQWKSGVTVNGTSFEASPEDFQEADYEHVKEFLKEESRTEFIGKSVRCLHITPNIITILKGDIITLIDSCVRIKNKEGKVICVFDPEIGWASPEEVATSGFINLQGFMPTLYEDYITDMTSLKVNEKQVFYFLKSSHGENFYKLLEVVKVKNEFHDWRDYAKYQQLGTKDIYHKPLDMFYAEFTKVEI